MSLNTTPRTWVTSEVVTAAMLNTEVRDALAGIQAAWTSYTPTFAASGGGAALGNGTLVGTYQRLGKTVLYRAMLTAGSTTNFGTGNVRIGLPATVAAETVGSCFIGDASVGAAGFSTGIAYLGAGVAYALMYAGATGATQVVSGTNPQTFASGDRIWIAGSFEVA